MRALRHASFESFTIPTFEPRAGRLPPGITTTGTSPVLKEGLQNLRSLSRLAQAPRAYYSDLNCTTGTARHL